MTDRLGVATLFACVALMGGMAFTDSAHPVRMPAEFEPVETVLFQWSPTDFDEEHAAAIREVALAGAQPLVLVDDEAARRYALTHLVARGTAVEKVRWQLTRADSVWTRDYGPTPVFAGQNRSRALVDWRFSCNTARYDFMAPLDDIAPVTVAALLNAPRIDAESGRNGLVIEGGDLLTDGLGTAFISGLLAELNGGRKQRVEHALAQHCGIERVVWLERLPVGPDNHVDMYIKVADEETLIVGEYDGGGDGVIERNVSVLRSLNSYYGTPYRIIRIPMPGECVAEDYRSYTNALIVNNRVLMPTYNLPSDGAALAIYRETMPGYDVVGIDCTAIIAHGGALHCITREIPPRQVLRVTHPRFREPVRARETVRIAAEVWGARDAQVRVHLWQENGRDFGYVAMAFDGEEYSAAFVPPKPGAYRYVIEAHAGGLTGYRPANGGTGGWLPLDVLPANRPRVASGERE